MPGSPFISAESLSYGYRLANGPSVLKNLSFQIGKDEYVLLCGASGSGKSTLCRTFNGLIPHFCGGILAGGVSVDGRSVTEHAVVDFFDRVGMVFQNPDAQLFNRSVSSEIAFGLESLGLPPSEIRTRMGRVAKTMGISPFLGRAPDQLSGGEKQLVAIAAILALEPDIIVLDEPYANLDALNVQKVRGVIADIHRRGTGVVVCEHRMGLTLPEADRILALHGGSIAADGPPQDVLPLDLEMWGIELPLSVKAGRALGQTPLPLTPGSVALGNRPTAMLSGLLPQPIKPPKGGSPPILEVDGLTCQADGKTILENVTFSIEAGETLAVVGANGAGKTTLIRHLNGLASPPVGRVRFKGRDITGKRVSELARHIGIAFQNPDSQFFRFTVREEIASGPKTLGCPDPAYLDELANRFRLSPFLDRAPFRLSGGEKKRVAFASALAARPDILILDEPTAGQDGYFRKALSELLARQRKQGTSIMIITHDLSFAEANAHQWMVLGGGRVLAKGSPREVMENSSAMAAARLEPTPAFHLASMLDQKRLRA